MEEAKRQAAMWTDLLAGELQARAAQHRITERALIYLDCGLPLAQVLDALKISRATWYRRVTALEEFQAENRSAARRMDENRETEIEEAAERLTSTNEN
jgi:hypothetical protein